jgi:hypothetical protein
MSYTFEVLPNEPIVIITLGEDFDITQDAPAVSQQYRELAESSAQPINLIADFRPARNALNVGSIVLGTRLATRGEFSFFTHPKTRSVTWIVTTPLMKLTAQGLSSDNFGGLDVHVFETREEAIADARTR